jgi:hypothetical protein
MENQAQLVSDCDRRQNDSVARTSIHVQAPGATVVEAKGSHAIYVSKPDAVAALIRKAAQAVAEK